MRFVYKRKRECREREMNIELRVGERWKRYKGKRE
jgi:hypothetical protein